LHLIHLTIENIGPFKGIHETSFSSLFGGNLNFFVGANGSGKTSFCRAIAWALGQYKTNLDRWRHVGESSASVTLVFTLGTRTYEVTRRQLASIKNGINVESHLKFRSSPDQSWESINNPDYYLKSILPRQVGAVILESGPDQFFGDDNYIKFRIPEFISWVGNRIKDTYLCAYDKRREHLNLVIIQILGGKSEYSPGSSEIALASFIAQALFREWILTSNTLPVNFRHLQGESLPWVLDCPFFVLDDSDIDSAVDILARLDSQIILLSSPNFLKAPLDRVLSPKLGTISVIKVGDILWYGHLAEFLGRTLVLTRQDSSNFSEIVPV